MKHITYFFRRIHWFHLILKLKNILQLLYSNWGTRRKLTNAVLIYSNIGYKHYGLLSFRTLSIVPHSTEHNVSEFVSVSVLKWKGGRHLFCWVLPLLHVTMETDTNSETLYSLGYQTMANPRSFAIPSAIDHDQNLLELKLNLDKKIFLIRAGWNWGNT